MMHLDGPRRDDEHLHTNISLLTDVVARQKDDWLQFAHNRLVDKKGFNLTENPHQSYCLYLYWGREGRISWVLGEGVWAERGQKSYGHFGQPLTATRTTWPTHLTFPILVLQHNGKQSTFTSAHNLCTLLNVNRNTLQRLYKISEASSNCAKWIYSFRIWILFVQLLQKIERDFREMFLALEGQNIKNNCMQLIFFQKEWKRKCDIQEMFGSF